MLESIFAPVSGWGLLVLRLAAGIIFIVHGWPKLNPNSEMKGPAGFGGFLKQMGVPLPILFGWLVALLETVGAVLLILGLGTRILAVLFAIDMLVAIFPVKTRVMKVGLPPSKPPDGNSTFRCWQFRWRSYSPALAALRSIT